LIDHAIALAEIVCGATFVQLEGVGHELHEVHWDDIIAAIIEHTER
jgi:pimeloyl-ACP methyl ester carboxylesterase